jgi:plastocyanin
MSSTLPVSRARVRALMAALGLLAALAVLGGPPPVARAANHAVLIQDFAFGPATMTVAVGDTVTWTNADSAPHTVSAENGAFDSGNIDEGQTFSFTFTAPGTYAYRCDYHSEMTATVVVQPAAQPAAAAQPTPAPTAPAVNSTAGRTSGGAPVAAGQPDTALPGPVSAAPPMAPLLIGLGLVALACAVIPDRARSASIRRTGGWRR